MKKFLCDVDLQVTDESCDGTAYNLKGTATT